MASTTMPRRGDRLPVWALVKALDMPEHKVLDLIERLRMPLVHESGGSYTSRRMFRELVLSLAAE
ncbi:hypothetical protein [Rhodococcus sp. SJ]|uniref:hypothetical protein n=1 Tax=Rhodococcus sp. SJ TaxID=3434112 RepID=UPI003D790CC4